MIGGIAPAGLARWPAAVAPVGCGGSDRGSAELEVCGGRLAALHFDVVAEFLALVQAFQPRSLDGGNVDENVLPAILRHDEAVSFAGVEPFDRAGGHRCVILRRWTPHNSVRWVGQ